MSDEPPKTPLAVALEYEAHMQRAPRIVAKGRGALAERIISLAQERGVVIESDPLLAEALAQVELDDEIPIELYEAVAIVIGFLLRRAKSGLSPLHGE